MKRILMKLRKETPNKYVYSQLDSEVLVSDAGVTMCEGSFEDFASDHDALVSSLYVNKQFLAKAPDYIILTIAPHSEAPKG